MTKGEEWTWDSARTTAAAFVSALLWLGVPTCSTSGTGLGPAQDGGAGGGTLPCYVGTVNQADWPAAAAYTSCAMSCGPDALGTRTCSQSNLTSCLALPGCVCLASPCAQCTTCAFANLPNCYLPASTASPPTCPATVANGVGCSPACARTLCIEADGITGCVCNARGEYACAPWGGSTWE